MAPNSSAKGAALAERNTVVNSWQKSSLQLQCINKHVFLADITKKVPIYVHFVKKLQTFYLRALGDSFFGWGAVYTFL